MYAHFIFQTATVFAYWALLVALGLELIVVYVRRASPEPYRRWFGRDFYILISLAVLTMALIVGSAITAAVSR